VILGYTDSIVEARFDGVYLDIIDAYEFFGPDGELPEREDAATEMLKLVERIAAVGRAQHSGFLIFPQNRSGILNVLPMADRACYLQTVDGIGAEDSFYFGDDDEDNPLDIQSETTDLLAAFDDAGRLVFAVDYLTDEAKIADFCARARNKGFVPLVTVRALDRVPQHCPPSLPRSTLDAEAETERVARRRRPHERARDGVSRVRASDGRRSLPSRQPNSPGEPPARQ
jgi:cysteinyl-tRNA synthetase